MTEMLGWHWTNGILRSGEPLVVGKTYRHDGELVLCPTRADLKRGAGGYHMSKVILDALRYAFGSSVSRVRGSGEIIEGTDKLVARERTVLWAVDAESILHEYACRCAEDALALLDDPDPRSIRAIEAKRAWLRGEATDNELRAARAAARDAGAERDAAWAAAWDAAWSAARDAAWDAAWSAARAATWAAAWAAAWDAERDSERDAAWAAAWDAERDSAWDRQNRRLTEMVCAAHTEEDGDE